MSESRARHRVGFANQAAFDRTSASCSRSLIDVWYLSPWLRPAALPSESPVVQANRDLAGSGNHRIHNFVGLPADRRPVFINLLTESGFSRIQPGFR
jgi:hypothetical protein